MDFQTWLQKNTGDGRAFEELTKRWFKAQPNVAEVWMWEEYPDRDSADMGIDIVVENREGQRWGVQCKNYSNTITWSDIATFAGASTEFDRKILVTSREDVTNNAHNQMVKLGMEHYGPAVFDGFNCRPQAKNKPKRAVLRPYQKQAVKACEGVQRGILHMPTGSGKTVVLSRIAGKKNTLFVVPSISLASQTARAFLADDPERKAIIVCSDSTTGREDENWAGVPVCKTVEEIQQYPEHSVFVTMNSLAKVVASGHEFELVLVDEAHRLAKSGGMGKEVWELGLPTIFATATPKVLHEDLRDSELASQIPSMDDEELFGPVVFSISVRELIDSGYLSDYQVNILAVREREIAELVDQRAYLSFGDGIMSAEDAAFYVGLEKAVNEYGISKIITYHSRVKQAEQASSFFRKRGFESRAISAKTPDYARRIILDNLKQGGIVTNARTLQEGIDVPSLDAVCFASPKYSKVDIVQSVGRALRLDPENPEKVGHIVLPVVVSEDDNAELELETSRFRHIYTVLQHLADEDELLQAEIEQIKIGKGRPTGVVGGTPRITTIDTLAQMTMDDFADQIRLHAVRPAGPTAQERVEAFVAEHGRLPRSHGGTKDPCELHIYRTLRWALTTQIEWAVSLHRRFKFSGLREVLEFVEAHDREPRHTTERRIAENYRRYLSQGVEEVEAIRRRYSPSTEERFQQFENTYGRPPKQTGPAEERRLYSAWRSRVVAGDEWAIEAKKRYQTRDMRPPEVKAREKCVQLGRLPKAYGEEKHYRSLITQARKKGHQWAIDLYEEYKDKGKTAEEDVSRFVREHQRLPRYSLEPNLYDRLRRARKKGEQWAIDLWNEYQG